MKNKLILLALLATVCSCKRWQKQYPEDTERTKLTPLERLAGKNGKWWTLTKVTLNGMDYTDSVRQKYGVYKVYFSRSEEASNVYTLFKGSLESRLQGNKSLIWGFHNNESDFLSNLEQIKSQRDVLIVPSCFGDSIFWDRGLTPKIQRLQDEIFILHKSNEKMDSTIINHFTAI